MNETNKENFAEDQDAFAEGDDLSVDKFIEGESNFIKTPGIGESVEFVLTAVKKQPKKKIKNPKNDKMMDICLSSVDYYFDFVTDNDKVFSCTNWQVYGKTKAIVAKLGKFGMKLKITHLADGRETAKGEDAWAVYAEVDGVYKQLDRESGEWVE